MFILDYAFSLDLKLKLCSFFSKISYACFLSMLEFFSSIEKGQIYQKLENFKAAET
jgi:hypothetical protein